jgi:hypothetical protein
MSIFAKKPDARSDIRWDGESEVDVPSARAGSARPYGIEDAIQLMRALPIDQSSQNLQNADLVVHVVRLTLDSLEVRIEDIVEDAARKQKTLQDRLVALQSHVGELEEQLEARRREMVALEADLKETTTVKERLRPVENSGARAPQLATQGTGPSAPLVSPPALATVRPQLPKPAERELPRPVKVGVIG